MKNYLEHSDLVKYAEGILRGSQDWQWFIDLIEQEIEFDENTYSSFESVIHSIHGDIFARLVRINKICNKKLKINNEIVKIYYIASEIYNGNEISYEKIASTNFGSILLLGVLLAKTLNNSSVYDYSLLFYSNMFKYHDLSKLDIFQLEINNLLDAIGYSDFDKYKKTLQDNVNGYERKYHLGELDILKKIIISNKSFDYNHVNSNIDNNSIEVKMILDMVSVSFDSDKHIHPFASGRGFKTPNYDEWTRTVFKELQRYFVNDLTPRFVYETINYIMYNEKPSKEVIDLHIQLLIANCEKVDDDRVSYNSPSLKLLGFLKKNNLLDANHKKLLFPILSKIQNSIKDLNDLFIFYDSNMLVVKKEVIDNHYIEKLSKVVNIGSIREFELLIHDDRILRFLDNKIMENISNCFWKNVSMEKNGVLIASAFLEYKDFIIKLVTKDFVKIDKSYLNIELWNIEYLWKNKYYSYVLTTLTTFRQEVELPKEVIERKKEIILNNTYLHCYKTLAMDEKDICDICISSSENVMQSLCNNIIIEENGPKHSIRKIDAEYIAIKHWIDYQNKFIDKYSYKFLNDMRNTNESYYNVSIFDDINQRISEMVFDCSLCSNELFDNVQQRIKEVRLVKPDKDYMIAHYSQLFPLIEKYLRNYFLKIGITIYKDGGNFRDISELLSDEIIDELYKQTQDFNAVLDFLFIYYCLFCKEGLNYRNVTMHGFSLISNSYNAKVYFISLISLKMILDRLDDLQSVEES